MITDKGKAMRPIFEAMKEWGNTWDVLGIKERE